MTNEDKIIQDNIKLVLLYENLNKMTHYTTIKLHQIVDNNMLPTELDTSMYYVLKLTTEILKSYMNDKKIPIGKNAETPNNELLAHSNFLDGLSEIIKLYQILDNKQLGQIDPDIINANENHPLNEYRSYAAYNHAIYNEAYTNLILEQNNISEKDFFVKHPILNFNQCFRFI